jgi:exodeoxyribonuclease V beta subunit
MMHGFIDLLFEYDGKFYVADYKSTWLGDSIDYYQSATLYENNQHHLYDLQYLIYCLALHRYLKNVLPDYDPDVHFGGVYYLYLRGMHSQNTQGEGVFYTDIASDFLIRLDNIFGGKTENVSSALEGEVGEQSTASERAADLEANDQQQLSFGDDWE